ncbi:hypothetical protein Hdeb2414_s0003g00105981 [Helianthus debilis subsp. tardiflorus]
MVAGFFHGLEIFFVVMLSEAPISFSSITFSISQLAHLNPLGRTKEEKGDRTDKSQATITDIPKSRVHQLQIEKLVTFGP